MLTPEQSEHLEESFARAMDLPEDQRPKLCRAVRAGDPAVGAELESLLGVQVRADEQFLETPAIAGALPGALVSAWTGPEAPERLGPYRVLEELGQGGMGTVYRGEQSEPMHRLVALKLIRAGLAHEDVLARFERERRALAALGHEHIARFYDAGSSEDGRPWFAMEWIEGEPIDVHCDRHGLSLRQRIRIFLQVCGAVHHAHTRGLLHRDLKPSNLLVTKGENGPVAKVIDFGIARAVDPDQALDSIHTGFGMVMGTPEYMSPEQALGDLRAIDTRTDVYSLGVILYQLLTAALPFARAELLESGIESAQRILKEREPPRPSARVTTLGDIETRARERSLRPTQWKRRLKGDLDWILLRALAKDPDRRYSSVAAFAEDLELFLELRPVSAGPPSSWYRMSKLVRRQRLRAAGALLVLLAIAGGIFSTGWAFVRAEERQRRFDLLATPLGLERAKREVPRLLPPWPDKLPRMRRWLEEAEAIVASIPDVRAKLREMRSQVEPRDEERREAMRRAHPSWAILEPERAERAANAYAKAVLDGEREVEVYELSEAEKAMHPNELYSSALRMVLPNDQRESYDQTPKALAFLLYLESQPKPESVAAALCWAIAWAQYANGQFDQARVYIERSVAEARPDEIDMRVQFRDYLLKALEEAESAWSFQAEHTADLEGWLVDWEWPDEAQEFLHRTLTESLQPLESFSVFEVKEMRRRILFAEAVEEATLHHPNARHSWEEAARAIATADGVVASELYANSGLVLQPQMGLVPIGMNPATKLWEFYDLRSALLWDVDPDPRSAAIPTYLDESGRIDWSEVGNESGILYVLLPGGEAWVGGQDEDEAGRHYDDLVVAYNRLRQVKLAPFFLSRFELTQGQWWNLVHRMEATYQSGKFDQRLVNARSPIETVTWFDMEEALSHCGARLPHSDEWEVACRAGRDFLFPEGDEIADLEGHGNYRDATCIQEGANHNGPQEVPWSDGFPVHAPVGSFPPNPWGFHDMAGNVHEWCLETLAASETRILRGSSYRGGIQNERCAYVEGMQPSYKESHIGTRPARSLSQEFER